MSDVRWAMLKEFNKLNTTPQAQNIAELKIALHFADDLDIC